MFQPLEIFGLKLVTDFYPSLKLLTVRNLKEVQLQDFTSTIKHAFLDNYRPFFSPEVPMEKFLEPTDGDLTEKTFSKNLV